MMCRWLEKFISPYVSRKAAEKANQLGIDLQTLRSTRWEQQTTKLQDPARNIFHFEHFVPAGDMAKKILDMNERSVPKIVEILASAEIAWILKEEDKELTKLGFRKNRADPRACYDKAQILLI